MAHVAVNQDRAENLRKEYVYKQHLLRPQLHRRSF
jgi:hypothetical protein